MWGRRANQEADRIIKGLEDDRERLSRCEWEMIGIDHDGELHRFRVLGGWLYRYLGYANVSIVFVPESEVDRHIENE